MIEFTIPYLTRMSNGNKGRNKFAVNNERKQVHEDVRLLTLNQKPLKPFKKAQLTLIRCSSTEPDWDGIVTSFKAVVDGLVRCGILEDDKLSNTGQWYCGWEKVPAKKGCLKVKVEKK